jgi:hypothetical protein
MVPPDQVESEKQSPSGNIRFTADFQQLREWLGK